MRTITCIDCGIQVETESNHRMRCDECAPKAKRRLRRVSKGLPPEGDLTFTVTCIDCGASVEAKSRTRKRCDACKEIVLHQHRDKIGQARRERHLSAKECIICGKEFVGNGGRKCCSPECSQIRYATVYADWHRSRMRKNMEDPIFRLNNAVSGSIRRALKSQKAGRHWEDFVEYDIDHLIKRLESQFQEGMTWDNYGRHGWHVDHIVPQSWFSFESPDDWQFKVCWSLANLQPMWAEENLRKNNKHAGRAS